MTAYRVATWFALVELARNKLAMVLLAFFIPLWITIAWAVFTHKIIPVQLQSTGQTISGGGEKFSMIAGAVMSASLVLGFMMFSIAHHGRDFDQRLVADGFPRLPLLAAKLTVLLVSSVVVSGYATGCLLIYWPVQQPLLLFLGLAAATQVYGTLGTLMGTFLPGELEAVMVVIITSVIDILPQSPVANPDSDSPVVPLLPAYGAMQAGTAAGFTDAPVLAPLLHSAIWFTGLAIISFGAFSWRTRSHLGRDRVAAPTTQPVRTG